MRKLFLILFFFSSIILMAGAPSDLHKLLSGAGNASDYPGSSHMIVFEKTDAKVMDSGLSHVTVETLYKVLNTDGAKKLKSIFFPYDPQSAFTEVKEARVIKKCGKIIDLPVKTKDYTAPARAIYWGAREILLPVGRLEPGDGILVKTYRKGYTYALLMQEDDEKYIPPMRGHYYDIVPFYSNIPMLTKSYKVSMPVSKKVQYEFYNGEARHYVHFRGKRTEYFWEKKNILPVKGEANAVNPSDYKSKLLISTSPDWQAKSLWFNKVNEDYGSFEYSDEIKRKADEITRGAGTDMEKISRLTHWTAEEIRYSGISMGEGEGFTLHKGTMNYRDRCGVCKDIAGMLVTLLRAAGYESYPAMTMAGSRIDPIPADQFNHCVTVVKLDGKYKLLDPTWVPGVRELWSSAEQQQEYLMGVPEGAGLKSTPVSPPENHYFKFAIDSRVSPQGRLTGTIKIQAEGQSDARVRRMFSRSFIGEWQQVFE
ncbi:MAG: DUF3857 and transglutaminase domain-containing protein, partial [bacterium]|nr:DUF3857 and transglutaminase domain-containing protein [bacterium]